MKRILKACTIALVVLGMVKGAAAADLKASWSDGIKFETEDKAFKIGLNGRLQNDWFFFKADDDLKSAAAFKDSTEIRRAYLGVKGTIYSDIEFSLEYDLAPNPIALRDGYIGIKNDVASVRVGHFKEPFSLEQLTSDLFTTFMERSLADLFAPGYNVGIMAYNPIFDKTMTWAIGVFKDTDDTGKVSATGANVTGRLTGLPWKEEGDLIHLGVSGSYRNPDPASVSYSGRPESHMAPKLITTDVSVTNPTTGVKTTQKLACDNVYLFGFELAAVYGPASLQGEYVMANVKSDASEDPTFNGFYILGSYFLTGEQRPYDAGKGTFGRVKPATNFLGADNGMGAWELALRYSMADLDDGDVEGGKLSDVSAGINWYLNPNTKVAMNYVYADLDSVGNANIFETRFQIDF